jgi:hypothetical protein
MDIHRKRIGEAVENWKGKVNGFKRMKSLRLRLS